MKTVHLNLVGRLYLNTEMIIGLYLNLYRIKSSREALSEYWNDPDFFIYIQKLNQISKNNQTGVEIWKLPKPVNG